MTSCKTYPVESSHAAMAAEIAELRKDKAELLAALKGLVAWMEQWHRQAAENIPMTRAAIARAEAGRG